MEAVDPLVGEVLDGRYEILSRLGAGAMGAAYRGRHLSLKRTVAIKVLHGHLLADPIMRQRFEREAVLAGRLRHKNLAGVIDTGETAQGQHYIVMEFADGHSLADAMVGRPMPAARVHTLLRQLCDGLEHAHRLGLVHRDLKPENIIIGRDDLDDEVPRIVDFGIAIGEPGPTAGATESGRLTGVGIVLGTPHYMAPEQATGLALDARCDLFALGVVAYEMISGVLPFDGDGVDVVRANLLFDAPPMRERVLDTDIDPLLDAYARRLMARSRDQRPPSARAARELLELIARDRAAATSVLISPATMKLPIVHRAPTGSGVPVPLPVPAPTPVLVPPGVPVRRPPIPPAAQTQQIDASMFVIDDGSPVVAASRLPTATAMAAEGTDRVPRPLQRRWLALAALTGAVVAGVAVSIIWAIL